LNLGIVVVEVIYGVLARSLSLVADAGHNLGDVLGLVLAGGASILARRAPKGRRTYGFRRVTLRSALANRRLLLVSTGGIASESMLRLHAPEAIDTAKVMAIAALGVVVNGASALLFLRRGHGDLNVRSAFLHLAGDAAISLGVVVSAAVIAHTGWQWLDPV